jgi:hypothetical protein
MLDNYRVDNGLHCIQEGKSIYDFLMCRSLRSDKPCRNEVRKRGADPSTDHLPGKLIWHYYSLDGDLNIIIKY